MRAVLGEHLKGTGRALITDPERTKDPVDFVLRLLHEKDKYDRCGRARPRCRRSKGRLGCFWEAAALSVLRVVSSSSRCWSTAATLREWEARSSSLPASTELAPKCTMRGGRCSYARVQMTVLQTGGRTSGACHSDA